MRPAHDDRPGGLTAAAAGYILAALLFLTAVIAGCSANTVPKPERDYELEALHNEVRQVENFIAGWTGDTQEYSRIFSIEEYREVKRKIISSPSYGKLAERASFERQTAMFEAIVDRYETWVERRTARLTRLDESFKQYRQARQQAFTRLAQPVRVGPYEVRVYNAYYELVVQDPDQAYASARYVGLKQLNIIASAKDRELRLPTLAVDDFILELQVKNVSSDRILRPDGFVVHRQRQRLEQGATISKSHREYLVSFSDSVGNRYRFARALGVSNRDSKNGVRPGMTMIWSFRFNPENHPVTAVDTFTAEFAPRVFGAPLTVAIPMRLLDRPKLPAAFTVANR